VGRVAARADFKARRPSGRAAPKRNGGRAELALARLRSLPDAEDAPGDVDLPAWLPYDRAARFPPGRLDLGEWAPRLVGRVDVPLSSLRAWQYTVGRAGVAWQIEHPGEAGPVAVVRQRDGGLTLADGHHRVMAAALLGETSVPADEYLAPGARPAR